MAQAAGVDRISALRGGLLLAAFAPLACHPGLHSSFVLPKLALLALAVLLASAGAAAADDRPALGPLEKALAAGLLALAVSTALSADIRLSLWGAYNYSAYGVGPLFLCASLIVLASRGLRSEAARDALLRSLLVAQGLVGTYAALQAVGRDPFPGLGAILVNARAVATLGSPVSLGAYLALLTPLALHWTLARRGRERWLGAAALTANVAGLLASISRGSWISAAAAGAAFLAMTRGRRLPRWGLLGWAAAALTAGALLWQAGERIGARPLEAESARPQIWRAAWLTFQEHPLLGLGPDTFELGFRRHKSRGYVSASTPVEYQIHAHNDLLQALATTGLTGLVCYLAAWAALAGILTRALASPRTRELAAALGAGLLGLFLNMKINPAPLETLSSAALIAGALAALADETAQPGVRRPAPAWASILILLGGLACVLQACRLIMADGELKQALTRQASGDPEGARRAFLASLEVNPCETTTQLHYANLLIAGARQEAIPDFRAARLDELAELGRRAVRCHPGLSTSHHILGAALLAGAQAGRQADLQAAEKALDQAVELDRHFLPILQSRLRAALLRGDPAMIQEYKIRIETLTGGTHGSR